MASYIISILNQKGGVGKTTTAVNLAATLVAIGNKVLLVDLDPQGNATTGLGIKIKPTCNTSYQVILHLKEVKGSIIPSFFPGLDVIGANADLAGAEIELVPLENRERKLAVALSGLKNDYDYILIDCPPSLGLLTLNALIASAQVIIPVQCEFYALDGLSRLLFTIKKVKKELNPDLVIRGILLTMYDGRNLLNQQVAKDIQENFKEKVFPVKIPRNIRIAEAASYGKPVILYDRRSIGAQAYLNLTRYFLDQEKKKSYLTS